MADNNSKTWFRLRWRTLFLLAIAGVVGWSMYSYWSEYSEQAARKARELMAPAVGARCTIRIRADALRDSSERPTATQLEMASGQVVGKFVKLNDDWIVLGVTSGQELWVAREQVLLMRVGGE